MTKKQSSASSGNFWMSLFLVLTAGFLIFIFWPKIKELWKDIQFMLDFMKEQKGELEAGKSIEIEEI